MPMRVALGRPARTGRRIPATGVTRGRDGEELRPRGADAHCPALGARLGPERLRYARSRGVWELPNKRVVCTTINGTSHAWPAAIVSELPRQDATNRPTLGTSGHGPRACQSPRQEADGLNFGWPSPRGTFGRSQRPTAAQSAPSCQTAPAATLHARATTLAVSATRQTD